MGFKSVCQNRKAFHDYIIEDKYEAGIELFGTEVKSMRQGKANIKDSYVGHYKGEMFLYGMHISPYEQGNIFNKDPLRTRKLLLHKKEIDKIFGLMQRQGYTVIPLQCYLKNGRIKVEIALAKGKKLYDKRDAAAKKSSDRAIEKALKERSRN